MFAASDPSASATPTPKKPKKKDLITVLITAEVETVADPSGLLCSGVAPGDIITGTYTYDSAVLDSNPDAAIGDYVFEVKPSGIVLDLGDFVAQTDPNNVDFLIEILNDLPTDGADAYLLTSSSNLPLACGTPVDQISWQLDDPTGTALSSTALTKEPPNLAAFESIFGLSVSGFNDFESYGIRAHVTSASLIPG